jgi:hypothetical protein
MKGFTVLYGIRTNAEGRPNGATGLRRDREDNDVVVRADRASHLHARLPAATSSG